MKNLAFTLIMLFVAVVSFAKKPSLSVKLVTLCPTTTLNNKSIHSYSIEFYLENESIELIYFWTWSCGWSDNFTLGRNDIYFVSSCIRDAPIMVSLLPKMEMKYSGVIYSNHKINSIKDINIGFKFYNGLKLNKESYVRSTMSITKNPKKGKNTVSPYIIWDREPVLYIEKWTENENVLHSFQIW